MTHFTDGMVPGVGPIVVNLAPTGMIPTKAANAAVPVSPPEIVKDVLACAERGFTVVHVHARDENGKPTPDANVYARIIAGIREVRSDLVICASSSGRGGVPLDQRMAVLNLPRDVRPDMASLTLSSLNFSDSASVNDPHTIHALANRMGEQNILPELEVFDVGMANMAQRLLDVNVLAGPLYCNILLGNVAGAQARLLDIAAITTALPRGAVFALAGLGRNQMAAAAIAVATAHGVRIGLEDNLWLDRERTKPASNLSLLGKVHELAEALSRPIMTPKAFRKNFGLAAF
jgi:3-keto-5-aminohexanoate cleavage enzyme